MSTALVAASRTGTAVAPRIATPVIDRNRALLSLWARAEGSHIWESLPFPDDQTLNDMEGEQAAVEAPTGRAKAVRLAEHLLAGLPPRSTGADESWLQYIAVLVEVLEALPLDLAAQAAREMRREIKFPPPAGEVTARAQEIRSRKPDTAQIALSRMLFARRIGYVGRNALAKYQRMTMTPDQLREQRERDREKYERRRAELVDAMEARSRPNTTPETTEGITP